MQAQLDHHHEPHSRLHETVYVVSLLFGRDGMARKVAGLARLSSRDIVVDVGCGPGTAVRRARREGAALAVGVDPSTRMLRLGRGITSARRMDRVDFLEGSAESLPLDSASATVIWALQSVHHWEDRSQGLTESLRVLAPGGRLLLLERAVVPGARGHAAAGLTEPQANELATSVARAGFSDVEQLLVGVGRSDYFVTMARAPAP